MAQRLQQHVRKRAIPALVITFALVTNECLSSLATLRCPTNDGFQIDNRLVHPGSVCDTVCNVSLQWAGRVVVVVVVVAAAAAVGWTG